MFVVFLKVVFMLGWIILSRAADTRGVWEAFAERRDKEMEEQHLGISWRREGSIVENLFAQILQALCKCGQLDLQCPPPPQLPPWRVRPLLQMREGAAVSSPNSRPMPDLPWRNGRSDHMEMCWSTLWHVSSYWVLLSAAFLRVVTLVFICVFRITCGDDEERESRKGSRGCPRSSRCRGCTSCVCFGCLRCRFLDCHCRACVDFVQNAAPWACTVYETLQRGEDITDTHIGLWSWERTRIEHGAVFTVSWQQILFL